MIDNARLEDARSFCYEVAPELDGQQLYLLNHPEGLPELETTLAYAVTGRHIALREHLVERGAWRGHGPMIVFCHDDRPDRRNFLALVLHELAHVLPFTPLPDIAPTVEQRGRQEAFLAAWSAAPPIETTKPWLGHGADFIRRVLHLHYRALWQGVPIPLSWLYKAAAYRLSPVSRYLERLGSEPFVMRNATMQEIEEAPSPPEFSELFRSDTAAWESQQQRKTA